MDFALLALKTLLFGFIISIVTCYHGLAQPLRLEEFRPRRCGRWRKVSSLASCSMRFSF
jgi:hypothetical protein